MAEWICWYRRVDRPVDQRYQCRDALMTNLEVCDPKVSLFCQPDQQQLINSKTKESDHSTTQ